MKNLWSYGKVKPSENTSDNLEILIEKSKELREQIKNSFLAFFEVGVLKNTDFDENSQLKVNIEQLEKAMYVRIKNYCIKTGKSRLQVMKDLNFNDQEISDFNDVLKNGQKNDQQTENEANLNEDWNENDENNNNTELAIKNAFTMSFHGPDVKVVKLSKTENNIANVKRSVGHVERERVESKTQELAPKNSHAHMKKLHKQIQDQIEGSDPHQISELVAHIKTSINRIDKDLFNHNNLVEGKLDNYSHDSKIERENNQTFDRMDSFGALPSGEIRTSKRTSARKNSAELKEARMSLNSADSIDEASHEHVKRSSQRESIKADLKSSKNSSKNKPKSSNLKQSNTFNYSIENGDSKTEKNNLKKPTQWASSKIKNNLNSSKSRENDSNDKNPENRPRSITFSSKSSKSQNEQEIQRTKVSAAARIESTDKNYHNSKNQIKNSKEVLKESIKKSTTVDNTQVEKQSKSESLKDLLKSEHLNDNIMSNSKTSLQELQNQLKSEKSRHQNQSNLTPQITFGMIPDNNRVLKTSELVDKWSEQKQEKLSEKKDLKKRKGRSIEKLNVIFYQDKPDSSKSPKNIKNVYNAKISQNKLIVHSNIQQMLKKNQNSTTNESNNLTANFGSKNSRVSNQQSVQSNSFKNFNKVDEQSNVHKINSLTVRKDSQNSEILGIRKANTFNYPKPSQLLIDDRLIKMNEELAKKEITDSYNKVKQFEKSQNNEFQEEEEQIVHLQKKVEVLLLARNLSEFRKKTTQIDDAANTSEMRKYLQSVEQNNAEVLKNEGFSSRVSSADINKNIEFLKSEIQKKQSDLMVKKSRKLSPLGEIGLFSEEKSNKHETISKNQPLWNSMTSKKVSENNDLAKVNLISSLKSKNESQNSLWRNQNKDQTLNQVADEQIDEIFYEYANKMTVSDQKQNQNSSQSQQNVVKNSKVDVDNSKISLVVRPNGELGVKNDQFKIENNSTFIKQSTTNRINDDSNALENDYDSFGSKVKSTLQEDSQKISKTQTTNVFTKEEQKNRQSNVSEKKNPQEIKAELAKVSGVLSKMRTSNGENSLGQYSLKTNNSSIQNNEIRVQTNIDHEENAKIRKQTAPPAIGNQINSAKEQNFSKKENSNIKIIDLKEQNAKQTLEIKKQSEISVISEKISSQKKVIDLKKSGNRDSDKIIKTSENDQKRELNHVTFQEQRFNEHSSSVQVDAQKLKQIQESHKKPQESLKEKQSQTILISQNEQKSALTEGDVRFHTIDNSIDTSMEKVSTARFLQKRGSKQIDQKESTPTETEQLQPKNQSQQKSFEEKVPTSHRIKSPDNHPTDHIQFHFKTHENSIHTLLEADEVKEIASKVHVFEKFQKKPHQTVHTFESSKNSIGPNSQAKAIISQVSEKEAKTLDVNKVIAKNALTEPKTTLKGSSNKIDHNLKTNSEKLKNTTFSNQVEHVNSNQATFSQNLQSLVSQETNKDIHEHNEMTNEDNLRIFGKTLHGQKDDRVFRKNLLLEVDEKRFFGRGKPLYSFGKKKPNSKWQKTEWVDF